MDVPLLAEVLRANVCERHEQDYADEQEFLCVLEASHERSGERKGTREDVVLHEVRLPVGVWGR